MLSRTLCIVGSMVVAVTVAFRVRAEMKKSRLRGLWLDMRDEWLGKNRQPRL